MSKITLTWRDRNLYEDGYKIYKSQSSMDINNLPSPIATLGPDVTSYEDGNVIAGEIYYYIISAYSGDIEKYSKEFQKMATSVPDSIGSRSFVAGDMIEGYLGTVSSSEFISGQELKNATGVYNGDMTNSDISWWKFAIDGEIIYVATKHIKNNIGWDYLNNKNVVYTNNSQVITIGGYDFRVTLLTGADANPAVNGSGEGSEWNRLIYRVHLTVPTDQVGDNWDSYSTVGSEITGSNAGFTWCQESNGGDAVMRGYSSLANYKMYQKYGDYGSNRWRPVLRLNQ